MRWWARDERQKTISRLLRTLNRERKREIRTQSGQARPLGPTGIDRTAADALVEMKATEAIPRLEKMLRDTPETGEYIWSYGNEGWYKEEYTLSSYEVIEELIEALKRFKEQIL